MEGTNPTITYVDIFVYLAHKLIEVLTGIWGFTKTGTTGAVTILHMRTVHVLDDRAKSAL